MSRTERGPDASAIETRGVESSSYRSVALETLPLLTAARTGIHDTVLAAPPHFPFFSNFFAPFISSSHWSFVNSFESRSGSGLIRLGAVYRPLAWLG